MIWFRRCGRVRRHLRLEGPPWYIRGPWKQLLTLRRRRTSKVHPAKTIVRFSRSMSTSIRAQMSRGQRSVTSRSRYSLMSLSVKTPPLSGVHTRNTNNMVERAARWIWLPMGQIIRPIEVRIRGRICNRRQFILLGLILLRRARVKYGKTISRQTFRSTRIPSKRLRHTTPLWNLMRVSWALRFLRVYPNLWKMPPPVRPSPLSRLIQTSPAHLVPPSSHKSLQKTHKTPWTPASLHRPCTPSQLPSGNRVL